MAQSRVVVIVDAYSTQRYLAPLFKERGYTCVHVQSTPVIPPLVRHTFIEENFTANIVHAGDVDATLRALAEIRPEVLIPGMESGVELADTLAESLGLRSNGTALSPARRDKYRMVEAVRAAGVPAAEQVRAARWDEIVEWYAAIGGGRVVLKPLKSSGNDGVAFCDTEEELAAAFRAVVGRRSALDLLNDAVVVQEYLEGVEYYVNSVSLDGVHYACDIWKTQHLNVNGVRDLLGGSQLLPSTGPEQSVLTEYAFSVLDALGIRNGPAHTELKLTPKGPRLVETGARICGADLPVLTGKAIGASQLEWTVDAYLDPDGFKERATRPYEIQRHAVCVNMIAPASGTLRSLPRMDELRGLESYHDVLMRVRPGAPVARTVNDFSYPMLVHLLHEVEGYVLRDYTTARYLDGAGFYELEHATAH
ncbi:ATP-grasp domain-containing protein [Streptomyces sp. NPDC054766]|uniref:ATP-grasp domain-containing protein n=1 Tax=Streptomyces rhizosphaerihabitans TaxID=1266770 RepID=UPI0021C0C34C|nr:ATP-grasp domain-containing protein [Streptomyces rhizosphaerihabitans]MCT9008505.1 ATP-grasp domain-containing protein [Streptomyces rhizosphaerihabitans]